MKSADPGAFEQNENMSLIFYLMSLKSFFCPIWIICMTDELNWILKNFEKFAWDSYDIKRLGKSSSYLPHLIMLKKHSFLWREIM